MAFSEGKSHGRRGSKLSDVVRKPAPIVRNSKRRGKLSIFQGERRAVRVSKAEERDRRKD